MSLGFGDCNMEKPDYNDNLCKPANYSIQGARSLSSHEELKKHEESSSE
jgi:hypothetical protein